MPKPSRASTQVSRIIQAPRQALYQACLDPEAVATWRVPENMSGQMHAFDPREGGSYRMSLVYQDQADRPAGKTSADTDTFHGRFIELVPCDKIVELVEFESPDPHFAGQMTITTTFANTDTGTEVTILCQDIPPGIRPEDNEAGCRSSLRNLARLTESAAPHPPL